MNLQNVIQVLFKKLALVVCLFFSALAVANSNVILIHHPSVVKEELSENTLLKAYAMKKKVWSDNTPIRVFVYPNDSDIHKSFVKSYLNMHTYQLDRLWYRLKFSGTGKTPQEVGSSEEMIQAILSTPGSIGYVPADVINDIEKLIGKVYVLEAEND